MNPIQKKLQQSDLDIVLKDGQKFRCSAVRDADPSSYEPDYLFALCLPESETRYIELNDIAEYRPSATNRDILL